LKKDAHVLSLHNALGAWVFSIQGTIGKNVGKVLDIPWQTGNQGSSG
jgi:hypothetical protein